MSLGACSGSGSSGASSGSAARAVAPGIASGGADAGNPASGEAADGSSAGGGSAGSLNSGAAAKASPGSPAAPADLAAADKLVRTASMQVQVEDVESGAADVRRIAVAAGGMVVSENSTAVPSGATKGSVDKDGSRSVLALAVPSDTLDRVLDDVGKLGTTVQRSSSSRDVTSTYVDTQSRIGTMKTSLDQLRTLLAKTTALDQIISLETEISRRQADLDSLQAQLNTDDKKVSMSTLTVNLATAAQVVAQEDDGSGFLGGLRHGWRAFLTTFGGVLTVLGAVLPFLVVIAAVGGPVYVWLPRRRAAERRRQTQEIAARPSFGPGPSGGGGANGGPSGNGPGSGGPGGSGGSGGPGSGGTGSGQAGPHKGPGEGPGKTEEATEREPETASA